MLNIERVEASGKWYQRVNDTHYHIDTSREVIEVLERARLAHQRIRLFLGDSATGLDWNAEHDIVGTIGRSTGWVKIPILVNNARSMGGPALLDDCIVRIETTRGGRVIWKHEQYHCEPFTMRDSLMAGYAVEVMQNGEVFARFETRQKAENWLKKMSR